MNTLEKYQSEMENAILSNWKNLRHVRKNDIHSWKYLARGYGHGLGYILKYDNEYLPFIIAATQFFWNIIIKTSFKYPSTGIPESAKLVSHWIIKAMEEID